MVVAPRLTTKQLSPIGHLNASAINHYGDGPSCFQGGQSPSWLFKIVLKLGGPFGYTPEYFNVRPWESVNRYLTDTSFETMYGGMIYILSGIAE